MAYAVLLAVAMTGLLAVVVRTVFEEEDRQVVLVAHTLVEAQHRLVVVAAGSIYDAALAALHALGRYILHVGGRLYAAGVVGSSLLVALRTHALGVEGSILLGLQQGLELVLEVLESLAGQV